MEEQYRVTQLITMGPYLLLMWKLMTGTTADEIYVFLKGKRSRRDSGKNVEERTTRY